LDASKNFLPAARNRTTISGSAIHYTNYAIPTLHVKDDKYKIKYDIMFGLALRYFATPDDIYMGIARTYKFVMKAANMDAPRILAFVSCGLQNKTYMLI